MFESVSPGLAQSALGSVAGVADNLSVSSNSATQMSTTNEAYACFVYQNFSSSLQAYMLNYVKSVSDMYSIYR